MIDRHSDATGTFRLLLSVLGLMMLLGATEAGAQAPAQNAPDRQPAPVVVVGFVGGYVHREDIRHSEVQLIGKLQATYGNRVRAEVFENRSRPEALSFVLRTLKELNGADLSSQREPRPRIVLYGHSWGASAAIYLARDLQQYGIPVALTIQVDSVPKNGEDDSVIPPNVGEAINFYQDQGRIHGTAVITASDPSHTVILGNFRYEYVREPAECRAYPWRDRLLYKEHISIECDPHVWSKVSALIEEQFSASDKKVAELPHPTQVSR